MKGTFALVASFGLLLATQQNGCAPKPPDPPEVRLEKYGQAHFPDGAYNVQELGNEWYTFELETDGKKRKFLYHYVYVSGHQSQSAAQCITELSP